ncbi:MAG: dTMP kinase [Dehalococcoidia bacterium]
MSPHLSRGVLITLEGGDGSGKSTQARALAELLRGDGYPVLLTEEPAGTELGRAIKDIFKQLAAPETTLSMSPTAELFLFEAARAQHVEEVIRPALERGEVVLCDRFCDSTLAYQGHGRGLNLDHIRACNHIATGGLTPDLTLVLDVPPEIGLARADTGTAGIESQEKARDSIGQESLAFHRRVREGFATLSLKEPNRMITLDATLPQAAVTQAAWEHTRNRLEHIL